MSIISPEEFACGFARRPGMYLGSPTLERAIGFVLVLGLGLEQIVMVSRPADPDVLSPIYEHPHLLRRHDELNSKTAQRLRHHRGGDLGSSG